MDEKIECKDCGKVIFPERYEKHLQSNYHQRRVEMQKNYLKSACDKLSYYRRNESKIKGRYHAKRNSLGKEPCETCGKLVHPLSKKSHERSQFHQSHLKNLKQIE